MTVLEKAKGFLKGERDFFEEGSFVGPLFLIFTLSLANLVQFRFDFFFLSVIGLYLCSKWDLRGCFYSFVSLTIASLFHHLFFSVNHFWEVGLELSLGCSFLITALFSQEKQTFLSRLEAKIETKDQAISNLEQDLEVLNETKEELTLSLSSKIEALQKELEELQGDLGPILILNDVLRKKQAQSLKEIKLLHEKKNEAEFKLAHLQSELFDTKNEIKRYRHPESIAELNAELFSDLNRARVEKEEVSIRFQELSYLLEKKEKKVRQAEDQIAAIFSEKEHLEGQLVKAQKEIEEISLHWKDLSVEREHHHQKLRKIEELTSENSSLKQRLIDALALFEQPSSSDVEVENLYEKIKKLESFEALYKQLKEQFQEKKQVLHETRAQLFKVETELDSLKIETEQKVDEREHFSLELEKEMESLEEKISSLEEENKELFQIISNLNDQVKLKELVRKKK